jgi:hypothetical protein
MGIANKISATYKRLPPWGQAVAFVGVGLAAWVIYSRIRGSVRQAQTLRQSRAMLQSTQNDLQRLAKSGVKPSYPEAQYRIWADALFACYAGWGTCNDSVTWQAMKNDADVLKLIEAFGIRTIPSGSLNPTPDFTGSLPAVIRDEHNFLMIDWINRQFEQKRIAYRF